uniref:DNA-binding domain-containing protein n=1 Tax=Oscillatoriales cyanobacterium SpSt-402 TaxID=2282168 RepID=A0A832H2T7_9CYAN
MTPSELSTQLTTLFGEATAQLAPGSWQVDTSDFRLLVLLSDDQSWLRILIPIAPAQDAQPFFEQLLEANFDQTQEVRYALQQGVLWAVFQHSRESLAIADFTTAVQRLVDLRLKGLDECFNRLIENRVRQIIRVAKQQGQSMEATLQTLERFYQEGLMGDMTAGAQAREDTLAAWRYQLERLWNEE